MHVSRDALWNAAVLDLVSAAPLSRALYLFSSFFLSNVTSNLSVYVCSFYTLLSFFLQSCMSSLEYLAPGKVYTILVLREVLFTNI